MILRARFRAPQLHGVGRTRQRTGSDQPVFRWQQRGALTGQCRRCGGVAASRVNGAPSRTSRAAVVRSERGSGGRLTAPFSPSVDRLIGGVAFDHWCHRGRGPQGNSGSLPPSARTGWAGGRALHGSAEAEGLVRDSAPHPSSGVSRRQQRLRKGRRITRRATAEGGPGRNRKSPGTTSWQGSHLGAVVPTIPGACEHDGRCRRARGVAPRVTASDKHRARPTKMLPLRLLALKARWRRISDRERCVRALRGSATSSHFIGTTPPSTRPRSTVLGTPLLVAHRAWKPPGHASSAVRMQWPGVYEIKDGQCGKREQAAVCAVAWQARLMPLMPGVKTMTLTGGELWRRGPLLSASWDRAHRRPLAGPR